MALPSVENNFLNKLTEKKICYFYSTRLVDHFDTKQVIICDKISILDFAYVSYLKYTLAFQENLGLWKIAVVNHHAKVQEYPFRHKRNILLMQKRDITTLPSGFE